MGLNRGTQSRGSIVGLNRGAQSWDSIEGLNPGAQWWDSIVGLNRGTQSWESIVGLKWIMVDFHGASVSYNFFIGYNTTILDINKLSCIVCLVLCFFIFLESAANFELYCEGYTFSLPHCLLSDSTLNGSCVLALILLVSFALGYFCLWATLVWLNRYDRFLPIFRSSSEFHDLVLNQDWTSVLKTRLHQKLFNCSYSQTYEVTLGVRGSLHDPEFERRDRICMLQ